MVSPHSTCSEDSSFVVQAALAEVSKSSITETLEIIGGVVSVEGGGGGGGEVTLETVTLFDVASNVAPPLEKNLN